MEELFCTSAREAYINIYEICKTKHSGLEKAISGAFMKKVE